jgi:hypothetical protein
MLLQSTIEHEKSVLPEVRGSEERSVDEVMPLVIKYESMEGR